MQATKQTSASNTPVLTDLATFFLDQLRTVGVLAQYFGIVVKPQEEFVTPVASRVAFIKAFFELLEISNIESHAGLDFPIIYNTAAWSKRNVLAGYRRDTPVKLSEISISYLATWNQYLSDKNDQLRLSKAALWFSREKKSFRQGLQYLIDAHRSGYCLSSAGFKRAFMKIFTSCVRAVDEEAFFNEIKFDDLLLREQSEKFLDEQAKLPVIESKALAILGWLVELLESAIEEGHAAVNADEWLLAYARLGPELDLPQLIVTEYERYLDMPADLASRLERLTEIRADVNGYALKSIARFSPLINFDFVGFEVVGTMLKEKVGKNWRQRIRQDRFLLPDCLSNFATIPLDRSKLPSEFQAYTPKLAFPLTTLFGVAGEFASPSAKTDAPTPKEIVEQIESAVKLRDARALRDLLKKYPWNGFIAGELGIALDLNEQSTEAIEPLSTAVKLLPEQFVYWKSLAVVCRHNNLETDHGMCLVLEELTREEITRKTQS